MKSLILTVCACLLTMNISRAEEMKDLRSTMASFKGNVDISLPKDTYLLDFTSTSSALYITGKKNITIDFNGSTVVCNKQRQAFYIANCENVVIKNLYIEYDPPTCTQGTITAIDGANWDVKLHENYPITDIKANRTQVYDSETRELVRNFTTLFEGSHTITVTGDRSVRVSGVSNNAVKVGDYVVMTSLPASYNPHTFNLSKCVNCKLENITVYDSNCFSFFESDCERTHYYRCNITRKLDDPKYPEDRIRAGYADGIHSKHAKVGPIIEECVIEHSGDDCIAINGSFYPVYKVDEAAKAIYVLTTEDYASNIKPKKDDNLVVVGNSGQRRGQSVITKISTEYPTSTERTNCFSKLTNIREQASYTHGAKIELTEWVENANVGDMVYSNDRIGSGFKVINNRIGHNRSRAILIKASDGVIKGNTIVHSAMSAIAIAPEFYWLEAGCSQNLEIADNYIEDCMFDASMTSNSQAAAITVVAQAPNAKLAACGAFSNINIHGNTVTGCPFPAVFLNSIDGGSYYDNTLDSSAAFARRHGVSLGIPSNRAEYMLNCNNISKTKPAGISDTRVDDGHPAPCITDGVINITGIESGETATLSLVNMLGVNVGSWNLENGETVSLKHLNRGIYIAVIRYDGITTSHKISLY